MSTPPSPLDIDAVRAQFPVYETPFGSVANLDNAGGSHACRQTIEALTRFYVETKVQPHFPSRASMAAGAAMDRSRARWAEAMAVPVDEVHFGPSTSANTLTLAAAMGATLGAGDEVIVTDQDHEANRGAISRAAEAAGAQVVVWSVDPGSGLLSLDVLVDLLGPRTRVLHVPQVSNVIGVENDVAAAAALAHEVGAWVVCDGVSAAPHAFPDPGRLGVDVYVCSLYKMFSVHLGLMTVRRELLDELPPQGHFFNADVIHKRLDPAGPDHAQVAAAGAVLDYVATQAPGVENLHEACASAASRWQAHEDRLGGRILAWLGERDDVDVLGPLDHAAGHRCPTIAFRPHRHSPRAVSEALAAVDVAVGHGHFYSWRTLTRLGIDPTVGVVRASLVHYTSDGEVDRLLAGLDDALA